MCFTPALVDEAAEARGDAVRMEGAARLVDHEETVAPLPSESRAWPLTTTRVSSTRSWPLARVEHLAPDPGQFRSPHAAGCGQKPHAAEGVVEGDGQPSTNPRRTRSSVAYFAAVGIVALPPAGPGCKEIAPGDSVSQGLVNHAVDVLEGLWAQSEIVFTQNAAALRVRDLPRPGGPAAGGRHDRQG